MTPREEAIANIEECRKIHLQWIEWQERQESGWQELIEPEDVGDPDYHKKWVAKYDQVLEVLRNGDS